MAAALLMCSLLYLLSPPCITCARVCTTLREDGRISSRSLPSLVLHAFLFPVNHQSTLAVFKLEDEVVQYLLYDGEISFFFGVGSS